MCTCPMCQLTEAVRNDPNTPAREICSSLITRFFRSQFGSDPHPEIINFNVNMCIEVMRSQAAYSLVGEYENVEMLARLAREDGDEEDARSLDALAAHMASLNGMIKAIGIRDEGEKTQTPNVHERLGELFGTGTADA